MMNGPILTDLAQTPPYSYTGHLLCRLSSVVYKRNPRDFILLTRRASEKRPQ